MRIRLFRSGTRIWEFGAEKWGWQFGTGMHGGQFGSGTFKGRTQRYTQSDQSATGSQTKAPHLVKPKGYAQREHKTACPERGTHAAQRNSHRPRKLWKL
ncbi:hypothetical protein J2S60_000697 [Gleimia europaea]|nr:hypothetical protein [Gleimia europaea]